jgi:hypothetical protein
MELTALGADHLILITEDAFMERLAETSGTSGGWRRVSLGQ